MRYIRSVKIDNFWGDKTVNIYFNKSVNFLIGINGSGKTTIINLIAACLNADFPTLDKAQFSKIRVDFYYNEKIKNDATYIEVLKKDKSDTPYPNIIFNIKLPEESKVKAFKLNELEEEMLYRYPQEYQRFKFNTIVNGKIGDDINSALSSIINLTWLSINRINTTVISNKFQEEKSIESSIDKKVKELSTELIKYFGVLDKRYSIETEKFQKNVFLSLIEGSNVHDLLETEDLDPEIEKESLRQIFLLFKLEEDEFSYKLESHFKNFEEAKKHLLSNDGLTFTHLSYVFGTRRIHSIVQEWVKLNEKKNLIYKPKVTFIEELNKLLLRKGLIINANNELIVKTQSGNELKLNSLSSGEKQLLIILGESLLKEDKSHIYIADEPELSLHIAWQEKLVGSIKNVNPNSQIIFATHSPDIVGSFTECVINVENCIV